MLNDSERATILAALRFYQEKGQGDPGNRSDSIHDIATCGGEVISLDAEGIDALCERLNMPDTATPAPDAYLARFPPDHRETASRAYADGFADGGNSNEEEES